ncbi:MAG: cupin domain-containing protein [Bdellovibrionota bacterium]
MDAFKKTFRANVPSLIPMVDESFRPILELPFLHSLTDLLKVWDKSIQVHLPDLRDEASSIDTDAEHAISFYEQGMGLLFNNAHELSPMLSDWLQEIRQSIGLSALTYGRNLIYATPDGKGTAPHFDQNINFVLQVKGTKHWKVAPNLHLENPMTRHTMGQPVDPEMMSYLEREMPTEMPSDAQDFELKPGSLLYVPRGCWHSTEAQGDALALNFTFTAPTWIDLFSAALRGRLLQSPEWRETADLSEEKFNELLAGLVADIPNWRAEDILAVTEAMN